MITQTRLKELLDYNEATGIFTWRVRVNARAAAGQVAGLKSDRYRNMIRIEGKRHYAYRLAWLYVHGEFPKEVVDHVNRNPRDDRLANIRAAGFSLNSFNRTPSNSDKPCGVTWFKQTKRWRARIKVGGKEIALGYFANLDDAIKARAAADHVYFPNG